MPLSCRHSKINAMQAVLLQYMQREGIVSEDVKEIRLQQFGHGQSNPTYLVKLRFLRKVDRIHMLECSPAAIQRTDEGEKCRLANKSLCSASSHQASYLRLRMQCIENLQ
jgi:hypothetical protein